MKEMWKEIENCEGYKISTLGRICNLSGRILHTYKQNKGYEYFTFSEDGKTKHITIHRAVAQAFIPNPWGYAQVNHIDCNKNNNTVSNLEWCDQKYNYREGQKNYLYSHNEDHYFAKLKNTDIPMIAKLYRLGFTRATVSRILDIVPASLEAIEKGISYRELQVDFKSINRTKYKDLPNIKLPSDVRDYFKDNTVLNTLIAEGKVSV